MKDDAMQNIVLEGPDNAGKSTLAKYLADAIHWPIKEREGKPVDFSAAVTKCVRYSGIRQHIIDRHPVVSQTIYGMVLRDDPILPNDIVRDFYDRDNLIIYCRCIDQALEGHLPTMHESGLADTVDHIVALERSYKKLVKVYDSWAIRNAHIVYTNYKQIEWIISMVRGIINERHVR